MIGLFIIAHAPLASALRAASAHTYPEASAAVVAYDVPPGARVEDYAQEAARLLDAMGCAEVLILTDVFGATPCNIARQLAHRPGVRTVAGVSVPMLWRALNYRDRPVDDLVSIAIAGATQGAMQVASHGPQNQSQKRPGNDPDDRHHQQ